MSGTQLYPQKTTLNCDTPRTICFRKRLCKRMTCKRCIYIRRKAFVRNGTLFAKEKNLSRHITVTWLKHEASSGWTQAVSATGALTKAMCTKKAGPYIRVIDLGRQGRSTPHVHFLAGDSTSSSIERIARIQTAEKRAVNVKNDPAPTPENLLGYFYDQNFLPSVCDPTRPKGVRLLSASRGMRCGFPSRGRVRSYKAIGNDR